MAHEGAINLWGMARRARQDLSGERRRRARHAQRVAREPAEGESSDDAFDASWFDSSRALAQGLSVTEHDVGIEVLMGSAG